MQDEFYPTGVVEEAPEITPTPSRLEAFHGQEGNKAPVTIQKENARHRRILFMKAHGMSNKDIAEALGMTPAGVGLVTRQDWFRESLVQLMNACGIDGIKKAIEGAALDSVFKIIELRDEATSEAVQRDCAFDILDRYLGKAVQPIGESGKKTISDEARLDAEIAELQKKLGMGSILAKNNN
jgi:DNA-binding transcriptional MerR regulator